MTTDQLQFQEAGTVLDHYGKVVKVTKLISPYGIHALIYQCPLNVDWDGTKDAYGVDRPDQAAQKFPLQKGLKPRENGLKNAMGSKGTWAGVFSCTERQARAYLSIDENNSNLGKTKEDRLKLINQFIDTRFTDKNGAHPVVQIQTDAPARGYYVSQCNALARPELHDWDQRKYVDASLIAYQALSDGLQSRGVGLHDYGLVIRNDTGKSLGFYFGDRAGKGSQKVGECSGKVKTTLAPENNAEDKAFSFIVFPRSGAGVPGWQAPQFIDSIIKFRIQSLSSAANSRELAVRMAMGSKFNAKQAEMTDPQALAFQNIKMAFSRWGWADAS
jgi:hypothetical protein